MIAVPESPGRAAAPPAPGDDDDSVPLTLAEVRAVHPRWSIERVPGGGLWCQAGAWRFPAVDPDDAHNGIVTRETPMTAEQIAARTGR